MKYQVEYGAHPDVVHVHLALEHRISPRTYEFTPEDADQATGDYTEFIRELLGVRGTVRVYLGGYTITIHKSPAFSWDEVLWAALPVFEKRFGPLEEVDEPRQQPPDDDEEYTPPTPTKGVKH